MSTLKVNTVESATTPTVIISDGLSVSGVSTLSGGLKVGTAITMSDNGNFGITGIMTASSYVGDGSNLSGAGKILQIKRATFIPGTVSGTGATFYGVSAGNVQITPVAASSKFLLLLTGVNGHVNMEGATGNHGCRYYFGMSINSGSFVSATTGSAFDSSDEEPLAATHIQGALGNYFDMPIDYSYIASPSYSLGQTIDFRPYYTKNYAMGNSLTYYYQHNTQSSAGDHRNHFTVMEIVM
tara:strand:+ start:248 stop:967 length:720 start_codon:yes stop_codon:yes gene_type:complete